MRSSKTKPNFSNKKKEPNKLYELKRRLEYLDIGRLQQLKAQAFATIRSWAGQRQKELAIKKEPKKTTWKQRPKERYKNWKKQQSPSEKETKEEEETINVIYDFIKGEIPNYF